MCNKRFTFLIILVVLLSASCLSVAFAALVNTLNISGTSYLKAASWNIQLQNPNDFTLSSGARFVDNPLGGSVEGEPKISGASISFQAELDNIGDYIQFDVPIKNTGTIDARLESFIPSIAGQDSDLLNLVVTDSNGALLSNGSMVLNQGETKTITVKLSYISVQDKIATGVDNDIVILLIWKQK